jgi:hypothetical protein
LKRQGNRCPYLNIKEINEMEDPRQRPTSGQDNDPNFGQKEAEREKAELENEDEEEREEDELEPMERPEQQQRR